MEIPMTLKVSYTLAEIDARAPYGTMDIVALFKQKLGEKRPVLTRDACD